ncbi:MAG: hypothetical protein QOG97_49, partial [Acidimicrobiaceae bacterium]|nr:hypothetical protein [Acidimicrobiaceae bacterium]
VRAGILEERVDGPGLVDEILRDATLNEDQKQTLIRVYLSFVHENTNGGIPVAARTGAGSSSGGSGAGGGAATVVVTGDSPDGASA